MSETPRDSQDGPSVHLLPQTVRAAAGVLSLEAGGLIVAALILLVLAATHTSTRLWAALTVAGFALIGAAVLAFGARGLLRLRSGFRTPVLMIQLLALPVSYSLAFQAGRPAIGVPIMLAAVLVIALLFSPSARRALDRVI